MADSFDNYFGEPEDRLGEGEPSPPGWPVFAWIVILLIAGAAIVLREVAPPRPAPPGDDRLEDFLTTVQYRMVIGLADVARDQGMNDLDKALPPPHGPVKQWLKHVIVAGELSGPQQALAELDRLERELIRHKHKPAKAEDRLRDILSRLYTDYAAGQLAAPSLSPNERALLREQLGWFGELALAPRAWAIQNPAAGGGGLAAAAADAREEVLEPARRTFALLFGVVGIGILLGMTGLVGLIIFLALAAGGRILSRLDCPSGRGGIYAETFAVWLLLYIGLSIGALAAADGREDMILVGAAGLMSLLALVWPVLRGIAWREVRRDIGLTWGDGPLVEPAAGIACYIMALPLLAIGLVLTLILIYLLQEAPQGAQGGIRANENGNPFVSPGMPSHPILEPLVFGDWQSRIAILILAVVVAPIVEEIMFRGVLYRHLRDATCRWAPALSVVASGTVVSFLFAVLHPQGLVAVPVLMALAYGFTMAREWRGTLVPCIIGHALSNGLVTTLALLLATE